jgi:hypothetical protein
MYLALSYVVVLPIDSKATTGTDNDLLNLSACGEIWAA